MFHQNRKFNTIYLFLVVYYMNVATEGVCVCVCVYVFMFINVCVCVCGLFVCLLYISDCFWVNCKFECLVALNIFVAYRYLLWCVSVSVLNSWFTLSYNISSRPLSCHCWSLLICVGVSPFAVAIICAHLSIVIRYTIVQLSVHLLVIVVDRPHCDSSKQMRLMRLMFLGLLHWSSFERINLIRFHSFPFLWISSCVRVFL